MAKRKLKALRRTCQSARAIMEQRNFIYTSRSYLSVIPPNRLSTTDAKRIIILRVPNIIDIMTFANLQSLFDTPQISHIQFRTLNGRKFECALLYIVQQWMLNIINNTNACKHVRAVSELILWYTMYQRYDILEFNVPWTTVLLL